MAESLCQKRALEAFRLDPAKWGGNASDLSTKTKEISSYMLKDVHTNYFLTVGDVLMPYL